MANPQCENGFTKIANEIIDELVKTPLLGAELQICLFVLRKTYGFGKKEDAISLTQFEQATNKSRPTIVKALKHLQLVKIVKLVKVGNSKASSNVYSFNKNHETWELVKTVELVKEMTPTSKANAFQLVKGSKHTKESTKETKERASVFQIPSLQEITLYCHQRHNTVNPEIWLAHYESNGWMVGKNKMKNWKAAIITWEKSEFNKLEKKEAW